MTFWSTFWKLYPWVYLAQQLENNTDYHLAKNSVE